MTRPIDPTVSIVIPARNEATDLPAALGAIAAQDYDLREVEVVVVDGDSSDDTASVARELLSDMPLARFDVLSNPGGNTPSNLNRGLEWCSGDYVVRVDARSHIPSDYVRRTTDLLARRPDLVVTGGSQVAIARSEKLTDLSIATALNNPLAMGGSKYRSGADSGIADTVYLGVFRRHELMAAGGWDEHFSTNQDFELNQRMASQGNVWFEAGLPVGYVPRQSVWALFNQYHRFGRWKAHYWAHLAIRPGRRQLILMVVPPLGVAIGLVIIGLLSRKVRVRSLVGLALLGIPASRTVEVRSWAINVVIALAWWTGVVRGLMKDDVVPMETNA